jgi:hypothetical protein
MVFLNVSSTNILKGCYLCAFVAIHIKTTEIYGKQTYGSHWQADGIKV